MALKNGIAVNPIAHEIIERNGREAFLSQFLLAILKLLEKQQHRPYRQNGRGPYELQVCRIPGLFGAGTVSKVLYDFHGATLNGVVESSHFRIRENEIQLATLPEIVMAHIRNAGLAAGDVVDLSCIQGRKIIKVSKHKTRMSVHLQLNKPLPKSRIALDGIDKKIIDVENVETTMN